MNNEKLEFIKKIISPFTSEQLIRTYYFQKHPIEEWIPSKQDIINITNICRRCANENWYWEEELKQALDYAKEIADATDKITIN